MLKPLLSRRDKKPKYSQSIICERACFSEKEGSHINAFRTFRIFLPAEHV